MPALIGSRRARGGFDYNGAIARFKAELTNDGVLALADLLYVLAAPGAQQAVTPIVGSSSFTLTIVGGVTFIPFKGFFGNGTTGYLDTNYIPATHGVNYQQNSASMAACILTDRTTVQPYAAMGTNISGLARASYLVPYQTGGPTAFVSTNGSGISWASTPNAKGFWHSNRSASNANQLYRNESSVATSTTASTALSTSSFLILADRQGTGGVPADFSTDLTSVIFLGASLDATKAASLSRNSNKLMTAFGINVY